MTHDRVATEEYIYDVEIKDNTVFIKFISDFGTIDSYDFDVVKVGTDWAIGPEMKSCTKKESHMDKMLNEYMKIVNDFHNHPKGIILCRPVVPWRYFSQYSLKDATFENMELFIFKLILNNTTIDRKILEVINERHPNAMNSSLDSTIVPSSNIIKMNNWEKELKEFRGEYIESMKKTNILPHDEVDGHAFMINRNYEFIIMQWKSIGKEFYWQWGPVDKSGNIMEVRKDNEEKLKSKGNNPFETAKALMDKIEVMGHGRFAKEGNLIIKAGKGHPTSNKDALNYLESRITGRLADMEKMEEEKQKIISQPCMDEAIAHEMKWNINANLCDDKPKYTASCFSDMEIAIELQKFHEYVKSNGSKGKFRMKDPMTRNESLFKFVKCPSITIDKNGCKVNLEIKRISIIDS